jgi:hypothetical protein
VNDTNLYTHIDSDLPEPDRVQQLALLGEFWTQHRMTRTPLLPSFARLTGVGSENANVFCLNTRAIDYTFLETDLIDQLIGLYFTHINLFLPCLHRPTFERHLHDGLYFRNQAFASVVLYLCACAAALLGRPTRVSRGHDCMALLGLEMV